jgi:dimethylamine/trimethylamine dehydrogenase
MECAVTLARRGFGSVHLVDAAMEIGGRLRWTRRLPTLGDWGRIVDYRAIQLRRLGVEVITGRLMSASDVLDYGAELIVIATGSTWRADGIQPGRVGPIPGVAAANAGQVLTPEQVSAGLRPPGRRVVVYDTDGYYVGPGVAELLAADGFDVTIVTSYPVLSPVSDETLEGAMLRAHVHAAGIKVVHAITLTAADPGNGQLTLTGADRWNEKWSGRCDGLVLVTQQASDDALHRELVSDPAVLSDAGISVFLIGDAVAPRMLSEAIFDGHRLGREIDRPDPGQPARYLRERAELG